MSVDICVYFYYEGLQVSSSNVEFHPPADVAIACQHFFSSAIETTLFVFLLSPCDAMDEHAKSKSIIVDAVIAACRILGS